MRSQTRIANRRHGPTGIPPYSILSYSSFSEGLSPAGRSCRLSGLELVGDLATVHE